MDNALEVRNLSKQYNNFFLDNISFDIPKGYVCGFIGENGAGKTTTLKLILGMTKKEEGDIKILGRPLEDVSIKEDLGILFDQPYFQEEWTAVNIEKVFSMFYRKWEKEAFYKYLKMFSLDQNTKFKSLSRGMKMKLGMATVLSHNAKILLLDEPTAGLDPAARDEMLDLLREFMQKEDRSILFSTHITSDLEKIVDYIIFIQRGRIIYTGLKDELLEKYCIVRGGINDLTEEKSKLIIGLRKYLAGFEGMIKTEHIGGLPGGILTEAVTLEDIMVYYGRKEVAYEL